MQRAWLPVSLVLLALVAAPAWAAPEAPAPAATALPESGSCSGGASASVLGPVAVSTGGITAQSFCQANCSGILISCSGQSCSAADRNCPAGQQGFVQCDGSWTFCPQGSCSCPCGTCNTLRWFQTEDCCPSGFHVMEERRCTASGWVNTGNTDCLVECGGGGPL